MSYHLETLVRVILALVGFLGVLVAPWWVPLMYAAWEVPLIGLLMDFVWLPSQGHFAIPVFTLLGIIMVWLASPLRKQFLL